MNSIFFIEYQWENEWFICRSYDYNFFKTEEEARFFLENNRDSLPSDQPLRISEYKRIEKV